MIKRDARGHWAKGQSGNPRGRPIELPDFKAMCREKNADMVNSLVGIIEDEETPAAAKIAGIKLLWEFGNGRPWQAVMEVPAELGADPAVVDNYVETLLERVTKAAAPDVQERVDRGELFGTGAIGAVAPVVEEGAKDEVVLPNTDATSEKPSVPAPSNGADRPGPRRFPRLEAEEY